MQTNSFEVRYILQTFDQKYFKSHPSKPSLTTNPKNARQFDSEMLAEDFRVFIESTAARSFQILAITVTADASANPVVQRSRIPVVVLRDARS